MAVVIGLDTSCYTTSVCAVDLHSTLVGDFRQVLKVKQGNRGLRQSEAVFQHMNNLPNLITTLFNAIGGENVCAVAASSRPRPVEGSYMPVFSVSNNTAQILASALKVPLMNYSHQEGHIRAGIWSANGPNEDEFLSLHLSGGTTEVLKVNKTGNNYNIDIIGKSLDISAGQFIDRVGVALGLEFPCGEHLELLAKRGVDNLIIPSHVNGTEISFSGAETFTLKKIQEYSKEDVSYAVQKNIAKTLEKLINNSVEKTNLYNVLLVGGVASNSFIKGYLTEKLKNIKLFFGQPKYCTDNSVGVALLGVDYAKANINS